ncbi:MAG TPA: D-2-hydroxyacid dehydrogenase [Candidatus Bacteroides pullicola]|uniref:D-2-hydroxyacid dehydrogenase n=1 Tax=Candidatus Bacteroides pullicola TaxID=2838475 RepID=A0A9D2CKN7_9BACE|nr:D-2-hydroxyacid dehydrogenase [Candidatus Bacteroides pullicola]
MKIVVLDGYAANPGDLCWDELKTLGECTIYDRTAPQEVLARAKDAEVLLTNKTVLSREHIEALPALKYIGVLATGYNIVDVDAARKQGVVVTNIPAYSTDSVAQMVFAHILNIAQQVQHHSEEVHRGRWTQSPDFCFWDTPLIELRGKKLGIVGLGHTGQQTARIALGFSMKVMAYTSKPATQLPLEIQKADSLDRLFAECDIVSLHCPLNASTQSLVDARRLALMKPTAILINTARGPLVDEQALADALNEGRIYAAGLDVLSTEPPRADNPLLTARHCYITPHIAWASTAARERLMHIMLENLRAWMKGETINCVNK